jgi:hypothetical protein
MTIDVVIGMIVAGLAAFEAWQCRQPEVGNLKSEI